MKIIKEVIENYFNDTYGLGKYTLDIGTGSANMALTLSEMGIRCITIEKSQTAFEEASEIIYSSKIKRKPLLLKMDARKMTFLDETFDCVIAYRSMHHIKNAKSSLDEMIRVCKCGGKVIIIEHKKEIRRALNLLTVNRGEEHPDYIDMDEVYQELNKKEGKLSLAETKIGMVCVFEKQGKKKKLSLHMESSYIKIGNIKNTNYYFDSFSGKISFFQNGKMISIVSQKEKIEACAAQSICLNLANLCNLNCTYCYADGGNYGQNEDIMSIEIAQRGIEWFTEYTSINPHVILFGGEPLINKSVIKEILLNNGKNLSYSINTNAILLDEDILKLLIENGVKISISIDGTRETHDSQRIFKNGASTYDDIVEKLQKFPDNVMKKLWARMTITNNSNSLYDEVISLLNIGFTKIDMSFVSGNKYFSENEKVFEFWMKDIDRLASVALEKWLNNEALIYPFVKVFRSVLYGQNAQQTCTAGREMLSVQPNENIVPCFKFSDFTLGSLELGIDAKKALQFEEYKNDIRNLICDECWAYNFCGGLCPKDLFTIINLQGYRCNLIQQLVRCSLLYFCEYYIREPNKFHKQNLQNEMSQWLKTIKGERE